MDAKQLEDSAKPGDLIEIFRGVYEHWAIYIGKGEVVHLSSEATGSLLKQKKSRVLRQKLTEVVGSNKCRINNRLDDKYEPRDIDIILRDANQMVFQEVPYSLITRNCEHFVTGLRYGKPESKQVRDAASVAGGTISVAVILILGAVLLSSLKEKEEEPETTSIQQQQKD